MWILIVVSCFVAYVVASLLAHRYFHRRQCVTNWKLLRDVRRVLLVIAHPDDECLFFGPTLQGLLRYSGNIGDTVKKDEFNGTLKNQLFSRPDIHLLCLSSGDYRQQGKARKDELRRSCRKLGISDSNITVVEHSKLPDGPRFSWSKQLVKEIVLRHVEQLSVDTVVTFDAYGVSGHSNHASIYIALQQLYSRGKLPVDTRVFVLESVNIIRKYIGLLDVPWSCWRSNYCYITGWDEVAAGFSAMFQHRSQLTWYRVLYLIFSRYLIVNTLKRISPTSK